VENANLFFSPVAFRFKIWYAFQCFDIYTGLNWILYRCF